MIKSFSKKLTYNVKCNMLAFKQKFTYNAKARKWTKEECLNNVCSCLTDKALTFLLLMKRHKHLTYSLLLSRLEKRFRVKQLDRTSQHRFQQSTTNVRESLEEWSDRALTLTKAFKILSEAVLWETSCHKDLWGVVGQRSRAVC